MTLVSAPGWDDLLRCRIFWSGSPREKTHSPLALTYSWPFSVGSQSSDVIKQSSLSCVSVCDVNTRNKYKDGWGGDAKTTRRGRELTFSDAVAIRVPCRLSATQHSAPSWAGISTGGFSVLARSTIWTCPECVAGNASNELLLFGHKTHKPAETIRVRFLRLSRNAQISLQERHYSLWM